MGLKVQISIKKYAKKADSRIIIVSTNLLQRKNQTGVLNSISIIVVTEDRNILLFYICFTGENHEFSFFWMEWQFIGSEKLTNFLKLSIHIYNRKSSGPKMEPCGTPIRMSNRELDLPSRKTNCFLLLK